ncbi:fatty acid--CoA ligase [Sulfurospirillum multivorans]|uniref:Long-chain-fatty-acid--CoA ligase n=2 Tax=Sulfurospirillum multivorans TaxID=66821 RepID=A0AA86ALJ8_SULMK|nr:fatty acid--CoA ligase [Sulfurospirillum multivorans]AHJ12017.1 putative long-chain-fatty-acid--CoA ligase [Sulfurospirillum multivorans DSM 12446]QEH05520.1 putative long-chain-fatty-acid--CoA ligase [Sulfurospirillum multivorans]
MQLEHTLKNPYAHEYQLLIKNILNAPIYFDPNQEIVYRGEKRFTYATFKKRVHKLAHMLSALGVKKGDTVAVMDYDSHRYLECYFAIPMLGAILHTINIRLSPEQILYTIDHAEDDVILAHTDFLPVLEQIKGRLDVEHFIVLCDDEKMPPTSLHVKGEYEALLDKEPDFFEFPDFDENTRATTFYTTGTTGFPKGVYFTHRQLVLHTLGTLSTLGSAPHQGNFRQGDVYMPITPMFHVHAWGLPYVATMLGVKQVYPGRYIPDLLLELIDTEKVTFSHCVPTIMHMLFNSPKIHEVDLRGWKVMIGGAALPKAMCQEALKRGIDMFTGYGMSETCPILSIAQLTPEMLERDDDAQSDIRIKTGRSMALVEIHVVDETMQSLPQDGAHSGEIVVRSPWLTQGYFKDQKNSELLWHGGYLHTGDIATMDEKGYIKITDRMKDIIKVGGEWVSSLELEDIINRHPFVKEVAVIGINDDKWGERPLALVVKDPAKPLSDKELLLHAKEFINKGIMARESMLLKIKFVESIDKTSVGKIDKRELRKKYSH